MYVCICIQNLFFPFGLTAGRKRHSDVIQRARRLKLDDLTSDQGRGGGAEQEPEETGPTSDEIQVSKYEHTLEEERVKIRC